jgi:hypothetical protein
LVPVLDVAEGDLPIPLMMSLKTIAVALTAAGKL